jgi:hypothetical protein
VAKANGNYFFKSEAHKQPTDEKALINVALATSTLPRIIIQSFLPFFVH